MRQPAARPGPGKLWLDQVPVGSLRRSLDDLGLSTRPRRCLEGCDTIEELLGRQETDLMLLRGFGESCLTEVRRQLSQFTLHLLQALDETSIDPEAALPLLERAWSGPAQARRLSELLEECVELLTRTGQSPRSPAAPRSAGPTPLRPPLMDGSLDQVIDQLFAGIGGRDREVILLRFDGKSAEPVAFAEIGRKVGVTRERVRQVYGATMTRLSHPAQSQRRREITRLLLERFRSAGNLLCESQALQALCAKYAGEPDEALTVTRILLNVTPTFGNVRGSLWCADPLKAPETRETFLRMRTIVRNTGRFMTRAQVLAQLRPQRPAGITEAAAASCLLAHPDLISIDNQRFGLREWQSGIPGTLDDALCALLRHRSTPRTSADLAQELEQVLPDGSVPSTAQIERVLAAHPSFRRLNGGRYTLVESPAERYD